MFVSPFVWARIPKTIAMKPDFFRIESDSVQPNTVLPSDSALKTNSLKLPDNSKIISDSLRLHLTDSLHADSLLNDSVRRKKSPLDDIVDYKAKDSIILTGSNWGHLYGESKVTYGNIKLDAERIDISMDSSLVNATYGLDSVGKEFGYPVFTDNGTDYESKSMKYNFKSKKGYITSVVTQQGEGFVVANQAKKTEDDAFYMRNGQYTTCDHHDHPHFYLCLTKAKVKPGKNVVTGPAYLIIEDLPIPLGVPFGFFPFSSKYSSGVIMPTVGDEMERGFNLRGGGYYFAINDNIDLSLTGDIYTKGSWALYAKSTYIKRYKYSGSFNFSYDNTKSEVEIDDVGLSKASLKSIRIDWSHSQDPKANMFRTFSASVNYSSSGYSRNNLGAVMNAPDYTTSTRGSSVSINQRFPNSPWSLTATMNVNQNVKDSTLTMTLPDMTITMNRIAPFKRKNKVGDEHWYEKIQMSYNGQIRNRITNVKEDRLFKASLVKEWENGISHRIPVNATFSLGNINISPAFNYNERWYFKAVDKKWNGTSLVNKDTTHSFYRSYNFDFSISMQTKLYGMYKPLIGGDKIQAIRHVFTPSVSFSYNPDFSDPRFGSYKKIHYIDAQGQWREELYSPYQNNTFGTAPRGKAGLINFSFDNNIEMKIKNSQDSIKKISLIDQLGIAFSYNMMADSMKWSDLNTTLRLKLSQSLTVNLNGVWDTYMYQVTDWERDEYDQPIMDRPKTLNRIDRLRLTHGGGFGRLRQTSFSISPSINQDTFKKWFGKGGDSDSKNKNDQKASKGDNPQQLAEEQPEERKSMFDQQKEDDNSYDANGYIRNDVQWSLGVNYSVSYGYDQTRIDMKTYKDGRYAEYKRKFTHNLSFNGQIQPTKNWNFTFNASYDVNAKEIAYMNCNLTRDLHCWSITASFTPIGPQKYYFVSLRANSSLLQDLKYEKRGRSSSYDPEWD